MKAVASLMLMVSVVCATGCGNSNSTSSNGKNENKGSEAKTTEKPQSLNGHNFVDLGLPSGTLWATCNVGANSPEGFGEYFAWGETNPKSIYSGDNYKYWQGNSDQVTKYCNDASSGYNGYYDNCTTLEAVDDAATVNWGDGWRMPSRGEFEELIDYTTHSLTTFKDVPGVLFQGSNGNTLFLPEAGYKGDEKLYHAGNFGHYWSNSIGTYGPWGGSYFIFNEENFGLGNYNRCEGLPVRPVCSKVGR